MTTRKAVAMLAQVVAELAADCEQEIGIAERDRILKITEKIINDMNYDGPVYD